MNKQRRGSDTITFPTFKARNNALCYQRAAFACFLADIVSFEKQIDCAEEAVSARGYPSRKPNTVTEFFDGKREKFLVDLQAEVSLPRSMYSLDKCFPCDFQAHRSSFGTLTSGEADTATRR